MSNDVIPTWIQPDDYECWDKFIDRKQMVSAVIATLNEAVGLRALLEKCKEYVDEIVVVDGHSTDSTLKIAEECGIQGILDKGLGKGDALRLGVDQVGGEVIVFLDGDCSHNPSDIPKLVVPILEERVQHVIASRHMGGSDELHGDFDKFLRMTGSHLITLGINYRFGVSLTDSQNGFRAIKKSLFKDLDLKENSTTIEQEMTIKTLLVS